jgi:hypothetical protein
MPAVQPPAINNTIGIITDAMMDAGKLRRGDEPGSEELAEYTRRLNKLVNYFMTQGCKLWLIEDLAITLLPPISNTQGVALYTLGPAGTVVMQKPLRVISGYYLDIYGTQRPLVSMSYPDEYKRLSNVLQPGSLNSYAVDKQQLTLNVYFWMPPDAFTAVNGTAHLMLEQSVTQFTGLTDTMNLPIEWALPLEWGLADQISSGQPALVQAKCAVNAKRYKEDLENWDVEDADTMLQPDQRQFQNTGRFK